MIPALLFLVVAAIVTGTQPPTQAEGTELPRISAAAQQNVDAYRVMHNKAPERVKNNPTVLPNALQLRRSGSPKNIKNFRDRLYNRLNPKIATRNHCKAAFVHPPLSHHAYADVEAVMFYAPKAGDAESFVTTAFIESNLASYWRYGAKIGQRKAGDNGHSHGIFQMNDQGRLLTKFGNDVDRAYIPRENARASAEEFFNVHYHKGLTGFALAFAAQRPASYHHYGAAYNRKVHDARRIMAAWNSNCLTSSVIK